MIQSSERVYAIIDSQNLNLGVKQEVRDKNNNLIYTGWQLDFKNFESIWQTNMGFQKLFYLLEK